MNLLSKLHKNSVLTGPIESFCLACGCLLRSEEESYAHIHQPQHVDKLKALSQLDGYKDDCIIKIKEGYFCPYCNIILPTIKRVSLHVIELKHKENKIAQSITRHGDTIFLFDIVVIDPRSWHGVDGSTCSVCNEDYSDEKEHTSEPGHALKVIQAKCEFGDNYVYRNVDEDLFFCLICNDILPITDKESHHESKIHQDLYVKSTKEGAAIKNKQSSELNNNIAAENILPEVNKDSNTNVKSMSKDTQDVSNNNLKEQVTKVYNGSSHVVDDDRAKAQTDSQELNPTTVILSTEKAQTQVHKTEPTDKNQEAAKSSTPNKNTLKQEAPKITLPKEIQETKIDSKSNEDASKVNVKVKIQNNETQEKNTQILNKESKDSNEKAQETAKNIQTKDLKVAATPSPIVPKTKIEPVKPAPIKSNTNGTTKDTGKAEPYLYEFLKSQNFVIFTIEGVAFCTLCDVSLDVDIGIHCVDKHHSILYQKHMIRKNKLADKSGQDAASLEKEANNKIAKGNENIVPESIKCDCVKIPSKIDEPVASTKKDGKEAEVKESTDKNNQVVEKETETPENKVEDGRIPASVGSTVDSKNVHSRGKSTKKANKKAAKAKAGRLGSQSESTSETVLGEDIKNKAKSTSDSTNDGTCVGVNGKVSESNENSVTVNGKATESNQTSFTVNKKVLETQNITRNNDMEKVNGTTNGSVADAKEKLLTFIKTVSQVDSSPEDVVINCKYVVGNLSFVLLVRTGDKVECVACNETLTVDLHKHIATEEHRLKFEDCAVITSLHDEFIRQVKTEEYHCGYCNLTLPSWNETKAHLESYRHNDAKTSASWRLERYLPHMKHCEKKEVRSILTAVFRRTME